jgi:hypothetical protein
MENPASLPIRSDVKVAEDAEQIQKGGEGRRFFSSTLWNATRPKKGLKASGHVEGTNPQK